MDIIPFCAAFYDQLFLSHEKNRNNHLFQIYGLLNLNLHNGPQIVDPLLSVEHTINVHC